MIEQKMRSALLLFAGLALASGAWGQTTIITQTMGGNLNLASEYFGTPDGREVLFTMPNFPDFVTGASQPHIALTISDDTAQAGTGELGSNNTTMITFTLRGATFAASAGGTNLRFFVGGGLGDDITVSVSSGGNRGDSSVTYEVETTDVIPLTGGAKALYFFPPALQVAPVLLNPAETNPTAQIMGATIVASIDGRDARSSSNPFPRSVRGSGTDRSTGASIVNALPDGEILRLIPALAASLGAPGAVNVANVNIMNRKALSDGLAIRMAGQQRETTYGLKVGELSITLTPEGDAPRVLRNADVTNDGGDLDSSLSGTADVTVSGPFQQGDKVYLGEDRTSETSKTFDMAADGRSMTVSVPIETMAGTNVVYVPGGVMDLQPGVFRASLALDFNDARNASRVVGASSGTVQYAGITTRAYAYGVVRGGGIESSFIRVTCLNPPQTANGMCSVFMNCMAQDGTPYFGDAGQVPVNATEVFDSNEVARALDGGWSTGRGRCDLMSNGDLEVQHMVRTGSVQVNNSVVIGADGILDK